MKSDGTEQYGKFDLAENFITSLILVTKLKEKTNFFQFKRFQKLYSMKILKMLILLKTLSIHLYR